MLESATSCTPFRLWLRVSELRGTTWSSRYSVLGRLLEFLSIWAPALQHLHLQGYFFSAGKTLKILGTTRLSSAEFEILEDH
jgi:hypothetical protein